MPILFIIGETKHQINKNNISFVIDKFPYIATYLNVNTHLTGQIKATESNNTKDTPTIFVFIKSFFYGLKKRNK